jgi:hypothetical protein
MDAKLVCQTVGVALSFGCRCEWLMRPLFLPNPCLVPWSQRGLRKLGIVTPRVMLVQLASIKFGKKNVSHYLKKEKESLLFLREI